MNAKQFVAAWKREKEILRKEYTNIAGESLVSKKIASLHLSKEQLPILKEIVDGILADSFYTLLLGLDGEANIGGVQMTYKVIDEDGNVISECGEIEAEAWDQFQNEDSQGSPGSKEQ